MDQSSSTVTGAECPDQHPKYSASNHQESNLEMIISTDHTYVSVKIFLP